jgi:hypothetical protein
MDGSTALTMRALFISFCPTMAEKGKSLRVMILWYLFGRGNSRESDILENFLLLP